MAVLIHGLPFCTQSRSALQGLSMEPLRLAYGRDLRDANFHKVVKSFYLERPTRHTFSLVFTKGSFGLTHSTRFSNITVIGKYGVFTPPWRWADRSVSAFSGGVDFI